MREIKFRAWDKDDKVMFVPNNICHTSSGIEYTRELSDGINIKRYWQGESPNNVFLMQYTGLKDVNGKEIYEGDIIKWGHINGYEENPHRIAIVEFNPDIQFNCINLEFIFRYGCFNYQNTDEAVEVIGNIYENPELIERNY